MAFSDKVASFEASGFLFKDTVEVISLPDEKVKGVTIYISDFQRSMADRLSKDFFKQPSNVRVIHKIRIVLYNSSSMYSSKPC